MIISTIKNLSTISKVLLGTTAVLGTATTVCAIKDYKASKEADTDAEVAEMKEDIDNVIGMPSEPKE